MSFPNFPSGQPAAGTLLKLQATGTCPNAWHTIGNISDITGPAITIAKIKTTSHSSVPAGGGPVFDSYVPGPIDPGTLDFKLFIKTDTEEHRLISSWAVNRTPLDFEVVEPDQVTSIIEGSDAFFTQFKLGHPVAGVVEATCQIQTSGQIYLFES